MEIIFSTKRYKNTVTKRPRIFTNESELHKEVTIIANVVENPDSTYPMTVKPYKLDMSQFGEKVRDEMKFTLTNVSDKDLSLTLVSVPAAYIGKIDLPSSLKAGKTAEGKVKLRSDKLGESFEKSFTIEVNDEMHSRFTVPVKRMVQSSAPSTEGEGDAGNAASHEHEEKPTEE